MKCDELKPLMFSIKDLAYVDEIRVTKNFQNPHDHAVYKATEVDAAITELKAKLEDVQASAYAESVDAGMENRKLKRALWLARAERAKETQFMWNVYCHCDKLYFCKPFCVSTRKNPYRYISRMNVVEWDEFWEKIKNKCLNKAEEYK